MKQDMDYRSKFVNRLGEEITKEKAKLTAAAG
jgi:hypothetical protein